MTLIVCVDDNMGMLFNHRRQSKDVVVRERILKQAEGKHLWIMNEAAPEDVCFAEDCSVAHYEQWIDRIILYKWNRSYPADLHFDIPLAAHGWQLVSTEDFVGNSHEKITEEVYTK